MYTTDYYKPPFWAENSGFMTGRDPLGVQNSSIATYTRLLPGLTNLTLRIRYYGFYSWLISVYSNETNKKSNDKVKDQYNFIRRAELIIAFIMRRKRPEELSIIGADYTAKHEYDAEENGYYDIHRGADKVKEKDEKENVYWDFVSGALGQYYAGSLVTLKLISIHEKFFISEEKGHKLGACFAVNIPDKQKTRFLEIIESGHLTEDDIDNLNGFYISDIPTSSEEWNYYKEILVDIDGYNILDNEGLHSSLRRETIGLYLNYIDANHDEDFIVNQYRLNIGGKHNDASFGWYYYYLNEAFHFALETIFWGILVRLDGKEQPVENLISDISEIVVSGSIKSHFISSAQWPTESILKNVLPELIPSLAELEYTVKSFVKMENALEQAFQLMFIIFKETLAQRKEIDLFEQKYGILFQHGRLSENLKTYMEVSLKMSYIVFTQEVIKKIMNDHINTAYRKMGNGESNLLKFIIEDGMITHVQTMTPRHTSPRLRTLNNFMRDLSLIHTDGALTIEGTAFLAAINK